MTISLTLDSASVDSDSCSCRWSIWVCALVSNKPRRLIWSLDAYVLVVVVIVIIIVKLSGKFDVR